MIGKNIFAERLKKERTDRGLSQNALGKMVGLSKSTICKYETSVACKHERTRRKIEAEKFMIEVKTCLLENVVL